MDTLIIDYKPTPIKRIGRLICGLYFLCFAGFFLFNEVAISRYGLLFYAALVGAILALFLFLSNSLWVSNKKLLSISSSEIASNIKSHKFKIEWVNVSSVSIKDLSISFFIDGGKKEKTIDLSNIHLKDVAPIKHQVRELCKYKNIAEQ